MSETSDRLKEFIGATKDAIRQLGESWGRLRLYKPAIGNCEYLNVVNYVSRTHGWKVAAIGKTAVGELAKLIQGDVDDCESQIDKRAEGVLTFPPSEKTQEPPTDASVWDAIERELIGLLTLKQRSLFNPLWRHRNAAVKWNELCIVYAGSKGDRAIQEALKAMRKSLALSKMARVNVSFPSAVTEHSIVKMDVQPNARDHAEK